MLNDYLERINKELEARNIAEREDILNYLEEMILDREENGEDEEAIIASLGTPEEVVAGLFDEKAVVEAEKKIEAAVNTYSGVKEIKVDNVTFDFSFLPSDSDEVKIASNEDEMSNLKIRLDHGKLKIEQEFAYHGLEMLKVGLSRIFKNNQIPAKVYRAYVYVPDGIEYDIDSVSGNLSFEGIETGEIEIDSVSGGILLEDVSAGSLDIDEVSGDIAMNRVNVEKKTDIDMTSGDLKCELLKCDRIKVDGVSSRIEMNVNGRREDYDISISRLHGSEEIKNGNDKKLSIETVGGRIRYGFSE